MINNLEDLLSPHINSILNSFISNIETSLEIKGSFSSEEKKEFNKLLEEIMETIIGYESLIPFDIKDKITNIKHLLSEIDTVREGEEHQLNITSLSNIQEN